MVIELQISDKPKPKKVKLRVSCRRLALLLGKDRTTISKVFARKRNPSVQLLRDLARELNLSTDDLLDRIDRNLFIIEERQRGGRKN